jgi:anti-sigma factor RsiW
MMDREEARLILQSCRPGDQDAGDPQFAEALALAKSDPELAAWFAEQQKFDAQVRDAIQSLPVPLDLKATILAGENPPLQKIVELPEAAWWRKLFLFMSPVSWAMAATILIFLGLAIFFNQSKGGARFADYSARMVFAAVNDKNHVDVDNSDMKQVVAWLGEHHGENNFVLPVALNGEKGLMGCRVLDWHGQKISMLCYGLKNSGHVDLFVADAKIFSDAPPVDQPQFASSGGMPTASWSHDGQVYLLVGHNSGTDLEKVLLPKTAVKRHSLTEFFGTLASRSNFQKNFLE